MTDKFEQLATWYLRLNGYLTVPNFILHDDNKGSTRGEIDVLAVRFPYSVETAGSKWMKRDDILVPKDKKIDFIIAEIKRDKCKLNDSLTNAGRKNVPYLIKWLGMAQESEIEKVSDELYKNKIYEGDSWVLRVVCFGSSKAGCESLSGVLQIMHNQVIDFISKRFKEHRECKANHDQWDDFIKCFYKKVVEAGWNAERILEWLKS
jgi:hypothetical protein